MPVVSAFDDELEEVLGEITPSVSGRLQPGEFACGNIGATPVAAGLTGVGPARAAHTAAVATKRFELSGVIFVGIAGGVSEDVRVGDVVIPARWSHHDRGDARWFDVDPALLALAPAPGARPMQSCDDPSVCALSPRVVVGGAGVTGRHFVAAPRDAHALSDRFEARITDMETASVAAEASRRGLPFLAIRGVSDWVPSGQSERDIDRFHPIAIKNASSVALEVLRKAP